jgi:hypothetical protein
MAPVTKVSILVFVNINFALFCKVKGIGERKVHLRRGHEGSEGE